MSLTILIGLIILFISVIIHEVAHGAVANALGDPTARLAGRLTLNPLVHMEFFGSFLVPILSSLAGIPFGWAKPVPYNPYNLRGGRFGPALVAAAGPAVNILIAFCFALLVRGAASAGFVVSPAFLSIAGSIVFINLVLAAFNLVPIPPLDGSRILSALLPWQLATRLEALESNPILLIFIVIMAWTYLLGEPVVRVVFGLTTLLLGVGSL